jgi:small conductance mechanosensitive channel
MNRRILLGIFFCVSFLIATAPRHASTQETVDEQQLMEDLSLDELGEQAAGLVSRIRTAIDRGEIYKSRMAAGGEEDSVVYRLRIANTTVQLMADLHELVEILISLEKEAPQQELRSEVEEICRFVAPRLSPHINDLRAEIDRLRNQRASTAVQDRPGLESRIQMKTGRLDDGLEFSGAHIRSMEKLELDATEFRTTFTGILEDRALELSARIDLSLERIDELNARLEDTPKNADLPVLLVAAHKSLDINTASMTRLVDIMDEFGLSTVDYRAQLVTATRDISVGLLDTDVAVGLLGRASERVLNWLVQDGPGLLFKLFLFFVILLAARLLARLVARGVGKGLDASKLNISTLLRRMIVTSASNAVFILGFLIALSQMNVSLGPLLAGLGVAGFVVGFALQDTLANFAAGMMILVYRPYDVGDLVDVSGVFGKVSEMSLVSTTILTLDNQTLVVPNSRIWGDVIKNVTAQQNRRVDMVFGISYTDDIPKAEQILAEILDKHDKVLDDPEATVKLHTLGESSVDFVVRPWAAVDDYWDVYWDVTRAVKMRFDEEGVSIPFPQRDVHIYEEQVAKAKNPEADNE